MLLVTCRTCVVVGPRDQFAGRVTSGRNCGGDTGRGQCKPCRAAHKRAEHRAKPVDQMSNKTLAKLGLGHMKVPTDRKAEAEAKAAWHHWIAERAPDVWVAAYFAASGKPWRNPRLSDAEQYKMQYRLDMAFRCEQRVRLRAKKKTRRDDVTAAIRDAALLKRPATSVMQRLGYTPEQLKSHIERQFKGRMSWDAFSQGKIHIDHIRPLAVFDLSDPDQFREAFSLPNMRPLWAADNLAKSARVEHLL